MVLLLHRIQDAQVQVGDIEFEALSYQALYEALYTNYIFKIFTILQLLASFLHS